MVRVCSGGTVVVGRSLRGGGRRGWLGCVVGVQWLLVVACEGGVGGDG